MTKTRNTHMSTERAPALVEPALFSGSIAQAEDFAAMVLDRTASIFFDYDRPYNLPNILTRPWLLRGVSGEDEQKGLLIDPIDMYGEFALNRLGVPYSTTPYRAADGFKHPVKAGVELQWMLHSVAYGEEQMLEYERKESPRICDLGGYALRFQPTEIIMESGIVHTLDPLVIPQPSFDQNNLQHV